MEQKRCMGCMELYDPEYGVCPHCGYVEGTSADETVHMAPGTVLEGRYVMGKVLGYGGFGATYIAWDPVLEQKVAIKEYLPSEFSTRMPGIATVTVFGGDRSEQFREGMEKFVEEAKRLSKFQNEPGIVKIFDSFQANGTAYIIMEYLDGETLTSYLEREGTVSEEKVMEMLLPVMQSLQVVHNEGLLHRDIAPDNIFITKEGNVKLIDFGASRYATTSHSRSLTVIIKPGYSPEEQYRSHGDQGPHTDVYALSAVMYKMLTGMTPPDALERRAMIETKKKELLPDVHKKAKYVSPIMENAVLNAMNIQIEDRTADIPSFLSELQADKPVKRRYGKIKKIDVYAWPLWLKIVIPAVLAASVVTGILLATGVIDFPSLFSGKVVIPEGMVEVPNVEQVKSDEALQTLQDAGLTPVPKGNVESSYVEAGLILLQNPSGGTFARLGAQIYLTVSSGGEVVGPVNGIATVPYVVWNTQADAEAKLQKAGLKARITTAYDDNVNAGMVISQSLDANAQIAVNTEVTLVISLGKDPNATQNSTTTPEITSPATTEPPATIKQESNVGGSNNVVVPNVVGKTQQAATQELETAGFNVTLTQEYSNTIAAGKVIRQTPKASTSQKKGTRITIVVSMGVKVTHDSSCPFANGAHSDIFASEKGVFDYCKNAIGEYGADCFKHHRTDGNTTYEYIYEEFTGRLMTEYEMTLWENGKVKEEKKISYDSDGIIHYMRIRECNESGQDTYYRIYDLRYSAWYSNAETIYEYDSKGVKIYSCSLHFDRDDNYLGKKESKIIDYGSTGSSTPRYQVDEYDSAGNLIKSTICDVYGDVVG